MVFDTFNKEDLAWYVVTLKLKESMDAGSRSSNHSISSPSQDIQRPSEQLQIKINGDLETLKEGPRSPEFERIATVREKHYVAQKDDVAGTWRKLCIYKVPQYLRGDEDKPYIPNVVSIGPYHHGEERLRNMQIHKRRAFDQILKRCNQDAKLYFDTVKELEQQARSCYEGNFTDVSSNEFVEMMVVDGCFVLELFLGAAEGFTKLGYSRSDPVFAMRGSMHSIQRDMIMLENQIPLFILNTLFGLQSVNTYPAADQVAKLATQFFELLMPRDEPLTKSQWEKMKLSLTSTSQFDPLSGQTYLHCLHVFRQVLLGRGPQIKEWRNGWSDIRTQLIHCVTELKEAGIKFKKRKTDQFWDIKFQNGILKIPRLVINYGTKSVFLNLIAFE